MKTFLVRSAIRLAIWLFREAEAHPEVAKDLALSIRDILKTHAHHN
jgi:hypothetical protein